MSKSTHALELKEDDFELVVESAAAIADSVDEEIVHRYGYRFDEEHEPLHSSLTKFLRSQINNSLAKMGLLKLVRGLTGIPVTNIDKNFPTNFSGELNLQKLREINRLDLDDTVFDGAVVKGLNRHYEYLLLTDAERNWAGTPTPICGMSIGTEGAVNYLTFPFPLLETIHASDEILSRDEVSVPQDVEREVNYIQAIELLPKNVDWMFEKNGPITVRFEGGTQISQLRHEKLDNWEIALDDDENTWGIRLEETQPTLHKWKESL